MAGKILIIDDDPDIVDSMKMILEKHGYEVLWANSGKDGIQKAKEHLPGLIVLDVMMETQDEGFHVAYALKKDAALGSVPIIMVTAIGQVTSFKFDPKKDEDFIPVDRYIEKPVRPEEFLSVVREMLSR